MNTAANESLLAVVTPMPDGVLGCGRCFALCAATSWTLELRLAETTGTSPHPRGLVAKARSRT